VLRNSFILRNWFIFNHWISELNSINNDRIVVCIPAFNESKNIEDIIKRAKRYASDVIVYDDGSVDDTTELAKAAGAIVIRHPSNKGYGAAIKALFQIARERIGSDIIVTMDSDGQHDPDQIPTIVKPILDGGADIVIGSRFLDYDDKEKLPSYRSIGIKAITKLTQSVSYNNLTDAQSGFRAYSKYALLKINLFEEGMAISTEILLKAKERNLQIKEVPITIKYNTGSSTSTHNPISHGIGVMYTIIQFISLRHPLAFYALPGTVLLIIAGVYMANALELFSRTEYVSTNMILVSVGTAVLGVVLLSTGSILYMIISLLRGRI
jgi:glycosyltransferase involved in cell wall biosynthesis